ncbi:glyoxylate/hydroxypyruvate reductase A [Alkalimonas collagenimarina]|uniref:Glyoxylate/hydroxypyruvate reductase A n=1 Tax=Alkalimonas collagenimarina TaxID=400390 RepID=A0ABT9H0M0_9GAMM|nr:glyoxylate/hydroxypyruvate reductase A [Alkalimonas collagenimarina]MDP4536872.1 glyoxylate/hydroxypyruvate reductase A [Alkalimonas collagenimarina]
MSIALVIPDRDLSRLVAELTQLLPDVVIEQWPDIVQPERVEFAVVWKQPTGSLTNFTNLKAIQSYGAGVDSVLSDRDLPQVPLSRIVDPGLAQAMVSYLDTIVNMYQLRFDRFIHDQPLQQWRPKGPRRLQSLAVLGVGALGQTVAQHFVTAGFQVTGWSRSAKQIENVQCFAGIEQFEQAVQAADVVVCLLPLTAETDSFLNAQRFQSFKPEAIFVNVARGAIVDDRDLLSALDTGQLQAACLDVFRQEPLPAGHPFWNHPQLMITPHISAVTNIQTAAQQIAENYRRCQQHRTLLHQVDPQKGY